MVIVCGIDGSASSREASRAAAAMARRARDSLLLVHVQEALVFTSPGLVGTPIALANTADLDADRERWKAELAREAERLSTAFGIEVSTAIRTGLPDHELVLVAEEAGAELIVVASLGRRASTRWRFGSVADRLSQSSPVAVLVVRDARPLERWALEERALKVVLALGTGRPAVAAVRAANALCEHGKCELVEVHAYDPAQEARRLGLADPEGPDARRAIESTLARELPGRVGELKQRERTRFAAVPLRGQLVEILAEFVDEEHADLVLLGTHGWGTVHRHLLGSVSYGLLPMVETNVLVVPVAQDEPASRKAPERVRSVLVASDLGETGQRALDLALGLLPEGGRLVLLHVDVPPRLPSPMFTSYSPEPFPTPEERRVQRTLAEAELRKRLAVPGRDLESEVEVVEAEDVPQAILAAAERHDVDLLCLGTHRYGRVLSALMGSVARAVARRSPRPVLLVPPAPEE